MKQFLGYGTGLLNNSKQELLKHCFVCTVRIPVGWGVFVFFSSPVANFLIFNEVVPPRNDNMPTT